MKLFSNLGLTPSFASQLNTALLIFLKKIGPSPASFCLFSFFSTTILQKSFRLQRESNSDRWCRRRARWPLDRHHGPLIKFERSQPIFIHFLLFNILPGSNAGPLVSKRPLCQLCHNCQYFTNNFQNLLPKRNLEENNVFETLFNDLLVN